MMNVSFRLPSDELTTKFVKGAEERGMTDLKAIARVGGIRASIYNAMPVAGVEKLRDFMVEFRNDRTRSDVASRLLTVAFFSTLDPRL